MREISLSQGQVALVDDEDYYTLIQYKWFASKRKNKFYAYRNISINGKHTNQYMHRLIMNATSKSGDVDHIDTNGLNNQKQNLRLCSTSQNNMNQLPQIGKTSAYKGVFWDKYNKRFVCKIKLNGAIVFIKYCRNEIDAAVAYNNAALKYFGEFARINILPCPDILVNTHT